jgi:hypothetical protein
VIRLPFLAAGVAIYLGVRFLSRRRRGRIVRLRDGRELRLLSSVALLGGSASDLLALEYFSGLSSPAPDELRLEAKNLVETVGGRAEYATCRRAVVAVRLEGERATVALSPELIFTFRRGDSGSEWYQAEGSP